MTIKKRVEVLEKAQGISAHDPIQVITLVSVKPNPDGGPPLPGEPRHAHILAGPNGPSAEISRQDGESVEAFEARVEEARFAAHGEEKQA